MTVAEAYVHPGSMVLMEAGSYPTSRASSMIVASAAQRMGTVIKVTDEIPQMGRPFPNLFIVLPPNADWLQLRAHATYTRDIVAARQLQALIGLGCVPERNTHRVSLIGPPVVFEPTCHVPPVRVVVRPVDHTSLFVPHVLAVEAYAIAFL